VKPWTPWAAIAGIYASIIVIAAPFIAAKGPGADAPVFLLIASVSACAVVLGILCSLRPFAVMVLIVMIVCGERYLDARLKQERHECNLKARMILKGLGVDRSLEDLLGEPEFGKAGQDDR
jgi:hypothetical protein